MHPLARFSESLRGYKAEIDQQFDELIMAADLLHRRSNIILRENDGSFYIQVIGGLEEALSTLRVMTDKLEKIKSQRV